MAESTKGRTLKMYGEDGKYLCTIRCNIDLNDPSPINLKDGEKFIEVIDRNPEIQKQEPFRLTPEELMRKNETKYDKGGCASINPHAVLGLMP